MSTKSEMLSNHNLVVTDIASPCTIYPAVIDEPITPQAKGRAKRKPADGKSIEAWLFKQQMSNENLYRQQQVHDSEIISLESEMRKVEGQIVWLQGAVIALMAMCGGLTLCLI